MTIKRQPIRKQKSRFIFNDITRRRHESVDQCARTYLPDKLWVLRICDVILSDVSMKPIAKIQELVIQRKKDISYQT